MRYGTSFIGFLLLVALFLFSSCWSRSASKDCDYYCHPNVEAKKQQTPAFKGTELQPTVEIKSEIQSAAYLASLDVKYDIDWECRNKWIPNDSFQRSIDACSPKQGAKPDENFIGLALSGGGSRAAVFSAAVMFELQKHKILQQVDVISSCSGGSATAALYATTCDPEQSCPKTVSGQKQRPPRDGKWKEEDTLALLSSDLKSEFLNKLLWTDVNIVRYYTSSFDRTDIMAQTMTQSFYGNKKEDPEDGLQFMDINPQRPYLIINATNNTESIYEENCNNLIHDNTYDKGCNPSNDPLNLRWFSYTREHFDKIGSDLNSLPIAYAVAASAALPGVFHQATLRNFNQGEKGEEKYRHIHLLDAGVADNLSIGPLRYIIDKNNEYPPSKAPHKLIILVDSHTLSKGSSVSNHDPRTSVADYWFIDFGGAKDYVDIQYDIARALRVKELEHFQGKNREVKVIHIKFEDLIKDIDRKKINKCHDTNEKCCEIIGMSREDIERCRKNMSREDIERCPGQIQLWCDERELELWESYQLVKRINTDWKLSFKDVGDLEYKYSWEKKVAKPPCKKCEPESLLDVLSKTSIPKEPCSNTSEDQTRCVALEALKKAAQFLVGKAVTDLRGDGYWKSVFKLE
jgi:predicted acylesterase/phospholipase RssA